MASPGSQLRTPLEDSPDGGGDSAGAPPADRRPPAAAWQQRPSPVGCEGHVRRCLPKAFRARPRAMHAAGTRLLDTALDGDKTSCHVVQLSLRQPAAAGIASRAKPCRCLRVNRSTSLVLASRLPKFGAVPASVAPAAVVSVPVEVTVVPRPSTPDRRGWARAKHGGTSLNRLMEEFRQRSRGSPFDSLPNCRTSSSACHGGRTSARSAV
jgi:hypothetical protein